MSKPLEKCDVCGLVAEKTGEWLPSRSGCEACVYVPANVRKFILLMFLKLETQLEGVLK